MKVGMAIVLLSIGISACAGPAPPPGSAAIPTGAPATGPISTAAPGTPLDPSVEPPSPTAGPGGLAGLIDDLAATGAEVSVVGVADGRPLTERQVIVCANHEKIRVFEFAYDELRAITSAKIDPLDPSHIGGEVYSWIGTPRFWQRDRVIVLYVGSNEETVAVLTTLLGDPFAKGRGRPTPRPETC